MLFHQCNVGDKAIYQGFTVTLASKPYMSTSRSVVCLCNNLPVDLSTSFQNAHELVIPVEHLKRPIDRRIEIEVIGMDFNVRTEGRDAEDLTFDEALGLLASLLMPDLDGRRPCLGRLRTKEERRAMDEALVGSCVASDFEVKEG